MSATLLVLAAGMGSRFGGVKQIQAVGAAGEAIIDFSVYDAMRAGFTRVVFVIRRDIEDDFRSFVRDRFAGMKVDLVFQDLHDIPDDFVVPGERKKPWGTGQAVLTARDVIDEPFAVINADDFYGQDAYRVLYNHLSGQKPLDAKYAMVGYVLDRTLSDHGTVSRGICVVDNDGLLMSMDEHTKIGRDGPSIVSHRPDGSIQSLTGKEVASMNLFGFTPAVFDQFDALFRSFLRDSGNVPTSEFYIPVAVSELVRDRKATCAVLQSDAEWFGMTYREDVDIVKARIRTLQDAGAYPARLWK